MLSHWESTSDQQASYLGSRERASRILPNVEIVHEGVSTELGVLVAPMTAMLFGVEKWLKGMSRRSK